ncbi:MAG: polyprenyl synthetase family protein [Candidatus Ranarchaeia archaeon]|jgi:geranylgeranyl diphosphate synthase type I
MIDSTKPIEPQLMEYIGEIQKSLDRFLKERISQYSTDYDILSGFYNNIQDYISRGGKRIRPLLLRLAYEGVNGKGTGDINLASCSVELLHNSSLIHDDLVDNDDIRRGGPAFHILYKQKFQNLYPEEVAHHIGRNFALLGGNAVWNLGVSTLLEAGFSDDVTIKAVTYYRDMFKSLINGVIVEESMARGASADEKKYLRMINLKTSTLLKYGLEIGGVLGHGTDNQIKILGEFGEEIGEAFQIQDDILGSFGSSKQIGKSVENDIKSGKQTLLAIKAFTEANKEQKTILQKFFGNKDATSEDVEKVRGIFKDTGAYEYVLNLAKAKLEKSKHLLRKTTPPLSSSVVKALDWIADYIVNRDY